MAPAAGARAAPSSTGTGTAGRRATVVVQRAAPRQRPGRRRPGQRERQHPRRRRARTRSSQPPGVLRLRAARPGPGSSRRRSRSGRRTTRARRAPPRVAHAPRKSSHHSLGHERRVVGVGAVERARGREVHDDDVEHAAGREPLQLPAQPLGGRPSRRSTTTGAPASTRAAASRIARTAPSGCGHRHRRRSRARRVRLRGPGGANVVGTREESHGAILGRARLW